ncbi:hypothetical protein INF26_04955 [Olsenella sp. DSM 107455]|uniref:DUF4238 domain-containing protein n=1 Tax=Thermophilibacter gallinarum TaxID=2779357 RepID=A0ABR9QT02_9ACTN|nr:hypothetical protein [Thermophilibacter gallinarum]MBE5024200.1 hypothetical protein [Thermophilibacter gallinarum]
MTNHKIEWPLTHEAALESLEAFVMRARRVEAHSLVKSSKIYKLAEQTITATAEIKTNVMTVRLNCRPEDEEVFESLAARIRPCIINDPVNVRKAARSMKLLAGEALTAEQDEALDGIIDWYDYHIEGRNPIFGFEEIESLDDATKTVSATDVTLGMGWLYSDLIHANPDLSNRVALEFPYNSRYQNGVVLISHLALKITKLLELIRKVDSEHGLDMREGVWTDQIVAGNGPLDLHNAKVFIGKPLHEVSVGTRSKDIEGIEPLTAMRMAQLRSPSREANLICSDGDGNIVARFPGIYRFADGVLSVNLDNVASLEFFPSGSPRVPIKPLPEGSPGVFALTPLDDKSAATSKIAAAVYSAEVTILELKSKSGIHRIPLERAKCSSGAALPAQGDSDTGTG